MVTPISAYTVKYMDCHSPKTVKTYDAAGICKDEPLNDEIPVDQIYTILTQPTVRKVKGFSCRVTRSVLHFKCGAWGHLKHASVPKFQHPVDVTTEQCRAIANSRNYMYKGRRFVIELNKEMFFEVTSAGELLETPDHIGCKGEDVHIGDTLYTNVLVFEEYRFLIQEEEFIVSQDTVEVTSDHTRLNCAYQTLGCETGQATYTWGHFNQPCNLHIIRTVRPSRVMGTYFVDHSSQLLINTTGSTRLPSCPMELIRTDHPSIFLAQTSEVISLPIVAPHEIDVALQSQVHLNYMSYQLEREMSRQSEDNIQRMCKETRLKEQAEPTKLIDNKFGLLRGDVYHVFECKEETATIREDTSCWADIPIDGNKFINPVSRQLVLQSTKVPCSRNFPMIVHSEEGWIEILPHLKTRPSPLPYQPTGTLSPIHHADYSHGGLYSDRELQEWQHELSFPSYHKALLKSISYGSCLQQGHCPTAKDSDIQTYDLNKLVPNLIQEVDIIAKFKNFLHLYGDLMAFLCLLIIGIKLVSDVVLILVTAMRAGPAAAAALVTSLYLYNRSTYQRIMKRHRQMTRNPEEQAEQIPLQPSTAPSTIPKI